MAISTICKYLRLPRFDRLSAGRRFALLNDNVSISQQTHDSFLHMIEATLIYPHHLFKKHPALKASRSVFIVEDYLFFAQYQFHKNKLVYHRASMKAYKDKLEQSGYKVTYIDCQSSVSIGKILSEKNIGKAYLIVYPLQLSATNSVLIDSPQNIRHQYSYNVRLENRSIELFALRVVH